MCTPQSLTTLFRSSASAGLISFVLLSTPPALGGEDSTACTVGRISIEQHQVFDEQDTMAFHDIKQFSRPAGDLAQTVGKLANDVHILTREDVIRRELLFMEGEPYDQRLVDESARHLRNLGFIGNVTIVSDTQANHTIDVLVKTHDRWTSDPSMSVAAGGGVSGFGVGLREDNFLGRGQKVLCGVREKGLGMNGSTRPQASDCRLRAGSRTGAASFASILPTIWTSTGSVWCFH